MANSSKDIIGSIDYYFEIGNSMILQATTDQSGAIHIFHVLGLDKDLEQRRWVT